MKKKNIFKAGAACLPLILLYTVVIIGNITSNVAEFFSHVAGCLADELSEWVAR